MTLLNHLDDKLLYVSQSATIDSGDLDAAGELLLSSLADGLQIERVSIWFFNRKGTALTVKLALHHGQFSQKGAFEITRQAFPRYFAALHSERAIIADDAHHHPATLEFSDDYLQAEGISSMLDAPIRHRGEMVGIVCAEHTGDGRQWTAPEVRFVAAHADLYGRALSACERNLYERQLIQQNAALEQQVQERTAKLLEAEKMAALGKLVAGVAHEVNTPLGVAVTAISHCEEMRGRLQRSFDDKALTHTQLNDYLSETAQAYGLLSNNLRRASTLVQNFKRTAVDQSHFELSTFLLGPYLHTIVASLRPLLKRYAPQVVIDCPSDLEVTTYPGALAQIFTNLITNTCEHAFAESGQLRSPRIDIHCEHDEQVLYCIYRDNGKGMSGSNLEHAFEPFFTTNRTGGGSGLGLSIVFNLVHQQLGGELALSSQPGQGLTVSMQLPLNYRRVAGEKASHSA
ncbi:histidine kinase [Aliidiomarina sedimenti]|uniref:histidine kinase n=1 Tax=Aliidiomarina sedimenti TaxID=1933879 RepID=A0ABY0BUS0_9GAMM|nr:GAF domain-containing sensor histidine kinase [Aliidiomarina sedimenti]RUO28025.1 histidine kinase [Aliidiomarina sedimenti]